MGIDHLTNALGPTPQTEQAHPAQVKNSAGGFSFQVDDWSRLDRFLILGSEGGNYYATERKLTVDNAKCVERCALANGARTVARIVEISDAGRAPKNDPAILALAICARKGDANTRALAYEALPKVCRIGTHLFHFVQFATQLGGWGRALRRAVASWYLARSPESLANQLAKYQSRDGWSNRDLLRLSHPKAQGHLVPEKNALFRWATQGYDAVAEAGLILPPFIEAYEEAKKEGTTVPRLIKLIRDYKLPRECVPTQHLKDPKVWEALLPHMGLGAMVRNLGNMSKCGMLTPLSDGQLAVVRALTDEEQIKKSRLHPLNILTALVTYQSGHGVRGDGSWVPVQQVVDALDQAFYAAFGNVEPTNKRILLALDVSGSMSGGEIAGCPGITPRVGSAAMALVTASVEPRYHILGYSHHLIDIKISPNMRLDDAVRAVSNIPFGGTDCALPIAWAQRNGHVDAFVNYTDSETYRGHIHPHEALKNYRRATGIQAKAVCVGMTANEFSVLDANDPGSLNVAGFDSAAPSVISEFIRE